MSPTHRCIRNMDQNSSKPEDTFRPHSSDSHVTLTMTTDFRPHLVWGTTASISKHMESPVWFILFFLPLPYLLPCSGVHKEGLGMFTLALVRMSSTSSSKSLLFFSNVCFTYYRSSAWPGSAAWLFFQEAEVVSKGSVTSSMPLQSFWNFVFCFSVISSWAKLAPLPLQPLMQVSQPLEEVSSPSLSTLAQRVVSTSNASFKSCVWICSNK